MITARAPAKVNLILKVLRRREDGFHDIASLIAPFRGASPPPEPQRAGADLPASPFWWHERAFVARGHAGCCDPLG